MMAARSWPHRARRLAERQAEQDEAAIMNTASPNRRRPSSCGAKPLKAAMAAAETPAPLRRPKRSAISPTAIDREHADDGAPTISMIRKRAGLLGEHTQDSGNTVTMWNSAKLASGAKAPMTMSALGCEPSRDAASAAVRGSRTDRHEFGRHDDAQPGEQRDHVDREGDEERIAPAPVEEVGRSEAIDEEGEQRARHDQAERRAELRDHRVPAALAAGALSASSEAGRPRCRPARRPGRCGTAPAAAAAMPIVSYPGRKAMATVEPPSRNSAMVSLARGHGCGRWHEDQRAERPGDEGQREEREGIERAGQRSTIREDQRGKTSTEAIA
jgi:hypothetical protein